jgi:hypothetical protein
VKLNHEIKWSHFTTKTANKIEHGSIKLVFAVGKKNDIQHYRLPKKNQWKRMQKRVIKSNMVRFKLVFAVGRQTTSGIIDKKNFSGKRCIH